MEESILDNNFKIKDLVYSPLCDIIIAITEKGRIEYIDAKTFNFPTLVNNDVLIKSKFETDLFRLGKFFKGNPLKIFLSYENNFIFIMTELL